MGVMTDEMIANDLGVDIEDVYMQLSREKMMREQYGIERPAPQPAVSGAPSDPTDLADEEDDTEEDTVDDSDNPDASFRRTRRLRDGNR
jgi:capsid protein